MLFIKKMNFYTQNKNRDFFFSIEQIVEYFSIDTFDAYFSIEINDESFSISS